MRTFLVFLFVLCSFCFGNADAQVITYIDENRHITLTERTQDNGLNVNTEVFTEYADGFGTFNTSIGSLVSQNSTLTFNSLVATGSAQGSGIFTSSSSSSTFEVLFDLSDFADYSLDFSSTFLAQGFFTLSGPNLNISADLGEPFFEPLEITQVGVLEPGQYNIEIEVFQFSSGFPDPDPPSAFDLDFQISAVPEPSSLALIALSSFVFSIRRIRS